MQKAIDKKVKEELSFSSSGPRMPLSSKALVSGCNNKMPDKIWHRLKDNPSEKENKASLVCFGNRKKF